MKLLLIITATIVAVSCAPRQINPNCNSFCPMYIIKFCGSDGVTYNSNECFLKSQWCNEGRNGYDDFHTLHYGECTGTENLGVKASTMKPVVNKEDLLLS